MVPSEWRRRRVRHVPAQTQRRAIIRWHASAAPDAPAPATAPGGDGSAADAYLALRRLVAVDYVLLRHPEGLGCNL